MSDSYFKYEDRMQKAICAFQDDPDASISKIARDFGVARTTLGSRLSGRNSRSTRKPVNQRLNDAQEAALINYINQLDIMNAPLRPRMIENFANSILKSAHDDPSLPPPKVGQQWLRRWLERHPEYFTKRTRAIEADRRSAHNRVVISGWFEELRRVIQDRGIVEDDIWNFDETGFQIGIGKDQWIVTRDPQKKQFIGSNTNREYVTVVEVINPRGIVMKPFIIMSARCHLRGWFDFIEAGSVVGVSDTGYINDELAFQWIQHYNRHTKKETVGNYRLLLCDGYGSHLTREFVEFCEKERIILFLLPPHTSHLLQPLDVGVFQSYKYYHSRWIDDSTCKGTGKFKKTDFLHALRHIRYSTFKKRTIRHAFRHTGIIPFNPAIVIDSLPESPPATPEVTPIPSDQEDVGFSSESTPKTARKLEINFNIVESYREAGMPYRRRLRHTIKGAISMGYLYEQYKRDREDFTQAQHEKNRRSNASRARISLGGVVSSVEMQRMKVLEDERKERQKKIEWKKKWKDVMVELREYALAEGIIPRRQRKSRRIE